MKISRMILNLSVGLSISMMILIILIEDEFSPSAWWVHFPLQFSAIWFEWSCSNLRNWNLTFAMERPRYWGSNLTSLLLGKQVREPLWLGFSPGRGPLQQTQALGVLLHPDKKLGLNIEESICSPIQSHNIPYNPMISTHLKAHAVPVVRQWGIFPLPVLQESHS